MLWENEVMAQEELIVPIVQKAERLMWVRDVILS
nr:MAG TPA: hypothetical protein [Caudoviricetes sp.]